MSVSEMSELQSFEPKLNNQKIKMAAKKAVTILNLAVLTQSSLLMPCLLGDG